MRCVHNNRGGARIFNWRGGGGDAWAQRTKSLMTSIQGPLKCSGSSRVLDALSCYLSLFWSILIKKGIQEIDLVYQKFRGSKPVAPPPPLICHCSKLQIFDDEFPCGHFLYSWIYFTWPQRKQAAYKQATRGPMALSPFQGTRQWG